MTVPISSVIAFWSVPFRLPHLFTLLRTSDNLCLASDEKAATEIGSLLGAFFPLETSCGRTNTTSSSDASARRDSADVDGPFPARSAWKRSDTPAGVGGQGILDGRIPPPPAPGGSIRLHVAAWKRPPSLARPRWTQGNPTARPPPTSNASSGSSASTRPMKDEKRATWPARRAATSPVDPPCRGPPRSLSPWTRTQRSKGTNSPHNPSGEREEEGRVPI
ncbi:uncharacterized protein LOC131842346 [Achroia grisella]|uniref:uncharacterized protein LOC131842346 n=1 Tax=Achroia grisella TaxID=688607 RepID=UPI0027D210E1|nr:uncharacterized protein LOC131842346 [Achroia grisella]